jgi:hypothetical protein
MKFPGFTAEVSVYRTKLHYHAAGAPTSADASVVPLFIERCLGQGPPAVEAYWQPNGKGGGTLFVTGTGFPVGVDQLYVELSTPCKGSTPLTYANPRAEVICTPWTGCCVYSSFSVALPVDFSCQHCCVRTPCCGPTSTPCQGTVTARYFDPTLPSASAMVQMPC